MKYFMLLICLVAVVAVVKGNQISGGTCEAGSGCGKCNSHCRVPDKCCRGNCWCDEGYRAAGGTCIKEKDYGDSCETSEECVNNYCGMLTTGICDCPSYATYDSERMMCIARSEGETCTNSGSGTECRDSLTCYTPDMVNAPNTHKCGCTGNQKVYQRYNGVRYCAGADDGELCDGLNGNPANCHRGLSCDAGTQRCGCQSGYTSRLDNYYNDGFVLSWCRNSSLTTTEVKKRKRCGRFGTEFRYCPTDYVCMACPEFDNNPNNNYRTCWPVNGAATMFGSLSTLLMAVVVSLWKQ